MTANLLPTVVLKNGIHRNAHQIWLHFKYNSHIIARIKKIPNVRWSLTMKCWYVAPTANITTIIVTALNGVALVDSAALTEVAALPPLAMKKPERVLNDTQRHVLNTYYKYLKGKRYSDSTVKTYTYLVADFVAFHESKSVASLTDRDVELFLENVLLHKPYAISTHRQFISALKLFVILYPETGINDLKLERPKSSRLLPGVLCQDEVIRLLVCAKNLKHRAILAMIYSSGLRISELLNLELRDIHVSRKQVLIKNSKGRKDRYVVLADGIISIMNSYLAAYGPQRWFVEGPTGLRYSAGSVRKFLKGYAKDAKIGMTVTPHTLRHSYATHLLEQGINLRYIQELLGHSKPETTMIYTHVARKDLIEIKSPLDTALAGMRKTEKEAQKVIISGDYNR